MTVENDFSHWERLKNGERLPIDVNEPWSGYYKTRGKEGRFVPVAFWRAGGSLRCRVNNVEIPEQRALELWPYAAKAPVSYSDYCSCVESGKWPGEHQAVLNHNAAPPDDSVEAIVERIDDLAREAEKMIEAGGAKDDATSDQASDLANTLGEIENKVRDLHKREKEPHLESGRLVDRKWFPIRDRAEDLKRRLKLAVVTPWLRFKDEEARKAKVAAISAGAAPETLPQQRTTAGSSKRSTALRTQISAKVNDWGALLAALKDHPDIHEAAQRIANASAKAGVALPGTEIIKEKVAA